MLLGNLPLYQLSSGNRYIESCFTPMPLVSVVLERGDIRLVSGVDGVVGAMRLVSGVVVGFRIEVSLGVVGVVALVVSNPPFAVSGFIRVVVVSTAPVAGGVAERLVSAGVTRPVSGAACPVVLSLLLWEQAANDATAARVKSRRIVISRWVAVRPDGRIEPSPNVEGARSLASNTNHRPTCAPSHSRPVKPSVGYRKGRIFALFSLSPFSGCQDFILYRHPLIPFAWAVMVTSWLAPAANAGTVRS